MFFKLNKPSDFQSVRFVFCVFVFIRKDEILYKILSVEETLKGSCVDLTLYTD